MKLQIKKSSVVSITKVSILSYFILFQVGRSAPDYPAGVLLDHFSPVGVFQLLPVSLSEAQLSFIFTCWPFFLVLSFFSRWQRLGLWGTFLAGCFVLGYSYNYGRVFHGTSLILQMTLLLALTIPQKTASSNDKNIAYLKIISIGQLIVCNAYFVSGLNKVLKHGFSWAWSENLAVILHSQALTTPLQSQLLDMNPILLRFLAVGVLIMELTSLLPWFFRRLAGLYVIFWIVFHLGISMTLGGHSTFFSHFFIFPIFWSSIVGQPSGFNHFRQIFQR